MAVLIASELRKEFAGDPLFEGISFTVGRNDRLSLAGANGAGKTTLLRAIAGQTSLQGGKLAFAKGTRIALHDQRPPLEFDVTLREYALSGARDLLEVEDELRRLETSMAEGAHDEATLRRYSEAQARLEHAGGWAWRDRGRFLSQWCSDRCRSRVPASRARPGRRRNQAHSAGGCRVFP